MRHFKTTAFPLESTFTHTHTHTCTFPCLQVRSTDAALPAPASLCWQKIVTHVPPSLAFVPSLSGMFMCYTRIWVLNLISTNYVVWKLLFFLRFFFLIVLYCRIRSYIVLYCIIVYHIILYFIKHIYIYVYIYILYIFFHFVLYYNYSISYHIILFSLYYCELSYILL